MTVDVGTVDLVDALIVILPTLGAVLGAYLGVRWRARSEADRELRALTDDAAAVLSRADQHRGDASMMFVQEGVNTSARGLEAIRAFRLELSEADQIRYRIAIRTKSEDPVHTTYAKALDALGEVSVALGTAAMMPRDSTRAGDLGLKIDSGESAFREARDEFLAAARARFG
jgi:hypothetical protein